MSTFQEFIQFVSLEKLQICLCENTYYFIKAVSVQSFVEKYLRQMY